MNRCGNCARLISGFLYGTGGSSPPSATEKVVYLPVETEIEKIDRQWYIVKQTMMVIILVVWVVGGIYALIPINRWHERCVKRLHDTELRNGTKYKY